MNSWTTIEAENPNAILRDLRAAGWEVRVVGRRKILVREEWDVLRIYLRGALRGIVFS